MLKIGVAAFFLTFAGLALPAGASAATLGECIAAHVTPDMKKTIVSNYLADGPSLIGKSVPQAATFAAACLGQTPTDTDIRRASTVMAGYWMKSGAEAAIVQRHRVTMEQLEAAWRGLSPALRERFARGGKADPQAIEAMVALVLAARPDLTRAALEQVQRDDHPLAILIRDITAYGIGRGMYEAPDLFEAS